MPSFNEIVIEFNAHVQSKNFLGSLDKFYDLHVHFAVNDFSPVIGLDNLRLEVSQFITKTTFHKIEIVSLLIENNLSVTNWYYSFEHTQYGRIDHHQLSVQRWKNNKIIQEHHLFVQ